MSNRIFPFVVEDVQRRDISRHYVEYKSMDEYTTRSIHGNRQREYNFEQRSIEINNIRSTNQRQIAVKERHSTKKAESRAGIESRGKSNEYKVASGPKYEEKQNFQNHKGRSTSLPRERDKLKYENSKSLSREEISGRKTPKQLHVKTKDDVSPRNVNESTRISSGKRSTSSRNRHRSEGDAQSKFTRSKSDLSYQKSKQSHSTSEYSPISSDESQIMHTDTTRLVSKRKTKSMQHFRTFYDMQNVENKPSIRKFSRHQKYFYSDEDSSEASIPLRTGFKNGSHASCVRNGVSADTTVDMDGSCDYSFQALEGYSKHGLKHGFPSAPYKRIKQMNHKNICVAVLGSLFFSIGAFLLFCPTAALLIVIFPVSFLIKTSLFSCGCTCNTCCECGIKLSRKERAWQDSLNDSTTIYQALLIIEFGLDLHRIRDLITARLICAEDKLKRKLYPKFTKKLAPSCAGMVWIPDHSFTINNHVYSSPCRVENQEDLLEFVSESSSKPLSLNSPLWEIQVVKNYGDHKDTILLVRVHPILSDGISLAHCVLASLTDLDSITYSVPKYSTRGKFYKAVKSFFCGPLIFLKECLFAKSDFNLLHGRHTIRSSKRVVSWSEPFLLENARRICQVTRSSLNEVLVSVAAGSLRSYLQLNGVENPYNMHSLIPVHYRSGFSEYSIDNNQNTFLVIPIPTNIEGAIPRLWKMKSFMKEVNHNALFSVIRWIRFVTLYTLPSILYNRLWKRVRNKCTCIISNLPGPEGPIRFGSRLIKELVVWNPPLDDVCVSINFISFDDHIKMTVMSDPLVLPNPELITKHFTYQMSCIAELLANRRIPGDQVTKRTEPVELDSEIHAEPTVEQIQHKMSLIQQELQDLKIQLESEGKHKHVAGETKIIRKIDFLKEQFRELLVESRQRRAAEQENAMILSEDDPDEDFDEDGEPKRPFRRRTLSISSRMSRLSTVSQSSTVRPLAANPTVQFDLSSEIDSESEASFRMDGISQIGRQHRRQLSEQPKQFEILEYASSPSVERKMRTF
ncbi:uncharacterized protein LOC133185410 isoform X1 [Saccostrea echinata]|uniref:uncharacterized protein LOC133185410 isoform X1 n=2 Tax=Saccostrea echinata TaxID=191078 RepID=UPI002A7F464C|nr:uncharacterized protein LOC133185410 isoform X1 [Saccostrea echinata]